MVSGRLQLKTVTHAVLNVDCLRPFVLTTTDGMMEAMVQRDIERFDMALNPAFARADYYEKAARKLGEDPLREGADAEAVWAKVCASKKSIGALLMDQTVIAGIGNIYRAEVGYLWVSW